jgi:hypothetical protein
VSRFTDLAGPVDSGTLFQPEIDTGFVRVEVRGLHLRPSYIPAFVVQGQGRRGLDDLILPIQGSASATVDSVSAVFQTADADDLFHNITLPAVFAAAEVPLALVDGETGRVVSAPPVVTWPTLRPASDVTLAGGPLGWDELPSNQRWTPQAPGGERFDEPIDGDDCEEEPYADEDYEETTDLLAQRHTTEELARLAEERRLSATRAEEALARRREAVAAAVPASESPPAGRRPRKTAPTKSTRSRRG